MSDITGMSGDAEALFASTVLSCLAEGVLIVLSCMAICSLSRQFRQSQSACILLSAVLLLFFTSFLVFLSQLITARQQFVSNTSTASAVSRGLYITQIFCGRVNYLSSDLIVVWRTWGVTDWRALRTILLISMFVTTGGSTIADAVITTYCFTRDIPKSSLIDLLLFGPLLATNVLATLIVAHKIWVYRRHIKIHIGPQSGRDKLERVLVLLVESGSVYCAICLCNLLGAFSNFPLAYRKVINDLVPYISAIYPTGIIVLIICEKKLEQSRQLPKSIATRTLRFASVPSLYPPSHSIIRSIANQIHSGHWESEDIELEDIELGEPIAKAPQPHDEVIC